MTRVDCDAGPPTLAARHRHDRARRLLIIAIFVPVLLAAEPPGAAVPAVVQSDLVQIGPLTAVDSPVAVAVDVRLRRVYVVDRGARMLLVHDAVTLQLVDKKALGARPAGIAIDPLTHGVYVANSGSGSITVYDPQRRTARETSVGGAPERLAIDATRGRIFVTQPESRAVDVLDRTLARRGRLLTGDAPIDVAVHPVLGAIFALTKGADVRAFGPDLAPAVPAIAPTGRGPLRLALDPVRDRLFALNAGDGTVTTIDARTMRTVGEPVPLALQPAGSPSPEPSDMALDVEARRLYVSNRAGVGSVSIVDANHVGGGSDALLGNPPVYLSADQQALALAVSVRSGQVFVASETNRSLNRFAPVTRKSIVGTGDRGFGAVVLDPATHRAFVAWRQNSALLATTVSPAGELQEVELGIAPCVQPQDPAGLALDPAGAHGCRLYAACPCADRVVTLDCRKVKPSVQWDTTMPGASGLALGENGARIFVTAPDFEQLAVRRAVASGLGGQLGSASLPGANPQSRPHAIAFDARSQSLFVAHELDATGRVTVLAANGPVVNARTQLGGYALDVAVRPGASHAYVANAYRPDGDGIAVLDRDGAELARIPVYRPEFLAFSGARRLYAGTQAGRVAVIDPSRTPERMVVGEFALAGGRFTGLAVDGLSDWLVATTTAPAEIVYVRTIDLF